MATLADLLRTGYTPPTEQPLVDPIKQHFASLPQKFEENQRNQMDLLARAYPGNTFKSNMLEGDPKAMAELAMQAPIIGMTAYHGTPHKILGAFDIKKMGTGEGAQAYGPGMYFAENPAVAKQYVTDRSYVGKFMAGTPDKTPWEANRIAQDTLNVHGDNAITQLEKTLKNNSFSKNPKQIEANKQVEEAINLLKTNELKPTGNLYKVDIPDEYIPNMLDWDKPFANQSKEVKEILKSSGLYKKYKDNLSDFSSPMSTRNKNARGENIQAFVEHIAGSPEKAAQMLDELGIKGIRYLDEGSRLKGRGTSNFVVFEPSTVKILEENSKPVSRKALIEEQVKKLKD
jgi:hypothetical protein